LTHYTNVSLQSENVFESEGTIIGLSANIVFVLDEVNCSTYLNKDGHITTFCGLFHDHVQTVEATLVERLALTTTLSIDKKVLKAAAL